jgi:hypothetical protein
LRLQVDVVHVQALERRRERRWACLRNLQRVGGVGVGKPVHALPAAVQVVEAVVLLVDDDDVLDLLKLLLVAIALAAACER